MLGEVVTSHEALLTLGTLKAFVPWEEEMPVTHRAHVQTLPQPHEVGGLPRKADVAWSSDCPPPAYTFASHGLVL